MKKDVSLYLADIKKSIKLIRRYAENLTLRELAQDEGKQDQIIRRLLVIGEAVKHIPADVKQMVPEIPWRKIAGMRDILVHDYDAIVPEQIMDVLTKDLDPLAEGITELEAKLNSK